MLKKREIEILELLNKKEYYLNDLMSYFSLSKRSIQYSINNINYYLSKNGLDIIKVKEGKLILNKIENFDVFFNYLELNKEDRVLIIYIYLIFSYLNISQFSKMINVSRNTVKSDMLYIKDYPFIFQSNKGYKLIDIDNKFRIKKLIEVFENTNLRQIVLNILDKNLLTRIDEFLKDIQEILLLNLNTEAYFKIRLSIYCYIKYPNFRKIKKEKYVDDILKVYKKYFDSFDAFMDVLDLIKGNSINNNLDFLLNENFLIKKLIQNISIEILIDLNNDKILYDFLLSHIKVAVYRLKNNIHLKNPIYQKLIYSKDPIIDILRKNLLEMEKVFNIKFTDSEIYLMAYHFKASIERTYISTIKKVILVCEFGYGTSRVLMHNLKEKFDIDIIDVLPAYIINKNDFKNMGIDYIISTVDLDVNHIKINPILTVKDYAILENLGIKRRKDKLLISEFLDFLDNYANFDKDKLANDLLYEYPQIFYEKYRKKSEILSNITKDRLIFKKYVNSWQECIDILGNRLYKEKSIEKSYIETMKNMIKKMGEYIVIKDYVALPHAKNENNVLKNDFSILILENPIKIKTRMIKFFFCFSTVDENSHLDLLNELYNLVSKDNFVSEISKIKTYDEFCSYLKKNL